MGESERRLIIPGGTAAEELHRQRRDDADAQRGTNRNRSLLGQRIFRTTLAKRVRGL